METSCDRPSSRTLRLARAWPARRSSDRSWRHGTSTRWTTPSRRRTTRHTASRRGSGRKISRRGTRSRDGCRRVWSRLTSSRSPSRRRRFSGGNSRGSVRSKASTRSCSTPTSRMSSSTSSDTMIYVAPSAVLVGDVTVEEGASIWHGAVLRGDFDSIVVGRDSNVQDNVVVHVDRGLPAVIGRRVTVGHAAVIHGCSIGDDCLVGMNSTINRGAGIGSGSVVASGAGGREDADFPAGGGIAGVPPQTLPSVARTQFYMQHANRRTLDEIDFILAHVEIDFESQATWGDQIQVAVWPSKIGNSSFTLSYEIKEKRSGRILARAKSVLVSYDYEKKKSKPISDDFRSLLQSGLEA